MKNRFLIIIVKLLYRLLHRFELFLYNIDRLILEGGLMDTLSARPRWVTRNVGNRNFGGSYIVEIYTKSKIKIVTNIYLIRKDKNMCGIVGYIGKKEALPILIHGLKRLEYRGYDSAGIAYCHENKIKIVKTVGRICELEKKISYEDHSFVGIGHTRWATHGGVTEVNSHPHQVGDITIVHNGILENYQVLREQLEKEGYVFQSDTDTEAACCYIDYIYQKNHRDMIKTLSHCMMVFVGSYAIVAMVSDLPDQLFVMKKDSPLIIGIGQDENYVASDISAYADMTSHYIPLEDMEIGILTNKKIEIRRDGQVITPSIKEVDQKYQDSTRDGFDHYMLKEIYEQKEKIQIWNQKQIPSIQKLPDICQYNKIHIVACGTAYHAGMIGKYLIEEYNDIEVHVFIASEYRYQKLFIDANTLVIVVSQSGETADTLSCVKRAQQYGAHTLGIVNVRDSSIARYVDEVIYTEAGQEIAVASTKAYTSQIYIFSLLAIRKQILEQQLDLSEVKNTYQELPNLIENLLQFNYDNMIDMLWEKEDIFYLGRNIDYVTMMEGSLKLKEISYIHSEAMPAGELKHGTISLMDEDTCVVVMATKEEIASKTISNIKEVKARGAKVVLLALDSLRESIDTACYDEVKWIPKVSYYAQPIINIIPLQLMAYYIAKRRGCDIDKPRNLAKSVTVE